jgi:hypothetical protein
MIQAQNETYSSLKEQERTTQDKRRINFSDGDRERHLRLLKEWLHPDLRDFVEVDWTRIPSSVIGYLVITVRDSPFAPHLTLAACAALGNVNDNSLRNMLADVYALVSFIQKQCVTWDGKQLTKGVWNEYISKTERTAWRRKQIVSYSSFTERHLPDYLERLDTGVRERLAPYILPRLPIRFLEQHGGSREVYADQQRRRKEKSDVLAPLHSILVALIQLRKQALRRLLSAYEDACRRAAGESLPLSFSYEEALVGVNRDARTVAEVRLEKRTVVLEFRLWNRRAWVKRYPHDLSPRTRRRARDGTHGYDPKTDQYFVEYLGNAADLLWFGDLIANDVLMDLGMTEQVRRGTENYDFKSRRAYGRSVGNLKGFATERPGLLNPAGSLNKWLQGHVRKPFGALVFDPVSLYRGCLFGAALATIALTNGSRLSELLQVSADRFKAHPYKERSQGRPAEKERVIWLQYLLPKGKKTEAERQLFPISPQSYELLREIAAHLKSTHGRVPIVRPHPRNTKSEDLKPERYLFQWGASPDGRDGAISPEDVGTLIRFILHGLEFRTTQGEPFVVSTHLLRHVMSTAARHEHAVPAEVIAFVLHHQQSDLAIPVATEYYTRMPEEQRLVALGEFMIELEEQVSSILLTMPDERTLEQMNEDLLDVFEHWHVLLETAFGFCGCVGLCPRGYNRNLCIGCPHLIPNPEKRPTAVTWRESYARQAEELEEEGNMVDGRQVRLQVQELDELINGMDIMRQAIEDGNYTPQFLKLPAPEYPEEPSDA